MAVIAEASRPLGITPTTRGALFGLAAVVMWALYLAFARAGVNTGLLPQDFILLRYVTAGAIMSVWLLTHGPRTLAGVGWRRGALLAVFAGPLFVALGVGGYVYAPLSHGAVIQPSVISLASLFLAWALFREALPLSRLIGAGIIIAGLVLIASASGGVAGARAWIGDLMFVGAGLFWVGFTLLIRHWGIGGLPATAAVSVLSALVVIPAFAFWGSFDRLLALDPGTFLTQVVVQGVFSGVLAVIAFGKAVEDLGAGRAALFPALVPAAALIIGLPVTGEIPNGAEWAGAVLATLGLTIAMGAVSFRMLG